MIDVLACNMCLVELDRHVAVFFVAALSLPIRLSQL
jgi:hypothetical protein